jgi:hypothetical protein
VSAHRWWSWRCFLFGHDIGKSHRDVRWLRDSDGNPRGFFCRRGCGALLGYGTEDWTGAAFPLMLCGLGLSSVLLGTTEGAVGGGWVVVAISGAMLALDLARV